MKIYYWPDGTWCYPDELDEHLKFMSDDFNSFTLEEGEEHYDIDAIVQDRIT